MKKSADRQPKPMGHEPQPTTTKKTVADNGSRENKGYKENRDHTTGAPQGDPRKATGKTKKQD